MVVRRDERGPRLAQHVCDDGLALRRRRAREVDARAVGAGAGDLGGRGDGRHDDVGGDGEGLSGEGEGLRVVSWVPPLC